MYYRIVLFCLLLFVVAGAPLYTQGQSAITGSVRDAQTKQPLPFAAVYLNFTTTGLYTNGEGNFVLNNVPFGKHELIASYPGYQSFHVQFENKDTTTLELDIALNVLPLQEVSITSSHDDKWRNHLQRFNSLFFGNTPLTRECRILNPWVLDFEVTSQSFKAHATAGLIIENLALGYRINYQLSKFEVRPTGHTVSGIAWFQELPSLDTALVSLWTARRASAWFGSARHLLLSIANQSPGKDGYELYEDISRTPDVVRQPVFAANLNKALRPFSIQGRVLDGRRPGDQYFLRLPPKLEVHYVKGKAIPKLYRDVPSPVSWLEVTGGSVEINRFGIVMNPSSIVVSGAMGELRMAELLPYNYAPGTNHLHPKRPASSPADLLLERTYIQTDKTLYYADESLRFKAYMKYSSAAYQDTLSNVLLVELVDESNALTNRKLFAIDTLGMSSGRFELNRMRPGLYQLRGYTRWMLNFDSTLIFNKTIRVLSNAQRVANRDVDTIGMSSKLFEVQTSRNSLSPGDTLTISLRIIDERGFAMPGHASLSIAPLQYASSGMGDPNIRQLLEPNGTIHQGIINSKNRIQYGIEVSGRLGIRMKAKKLREAVAMLSQENTNDIIARNIEGDGSFAFPPLQLYDSMKIGLQVIDKGGRKIAKVILDSARMRIVRVPLRPLLVALDTLPTWRRRTYETVTISDESTVLDEVTIVGARAHASKTSDVHLSPDLSISGEDLRRIDNGDILSLIQSRVPGLKVLVFTQSGMPRKYFKLGGMFTFDRNPTNLEPVVLIDGNMIPAHTGETAAEQVSRLSASQIDRIEVVKFGGSAAYGARGANGVIAIYTNLTRPAGTSGKEFIDRTRFDRINITGLSRDAAFRVQRSYEWSSTIYWNPDVTIRPDLPNAISIVAPKVTGRYSVLIEGMARDGTPLRALRIIDIK